MTQTSVALIGAGYTAREHTKAFADVPGVRLVGIHSRTRSRAETLAQEFGIPQVYDSVDALYAGTQADLVVVTVTEPSMQAVCLACMAHPWALFGEKPPGMDVHEAQHLAATAQAQQRAFYVALNRRAMSSTLAALDDLAQNPGPRFIHIQDQEDRAAALKFGQPQATVDHWMYANSIHLIDYFYMFGRGQITRVQPIFRWQPQAASPVVAAAVEFDSGDRGLYEAIWEAPAPWAVSISTPARRWELRPVEQAAYQNAGERQRTEIPRAQWDVDFKPGYRRQAEEVVKAVRGEAHQAVPLREAVRTMQLIQQIYELP